MGNRDRDELERLRKEALKANQRVGRKLGRLRREAKITQTRGIDPRVSRDRIGRMNRIQLRSYLERAENFMLRRTQFVAGSSGAPIRRHVFEEYKRIEERANRRRKEFVDSIKGAVSPSGRGTVGDFIGDFGSDRVKRHMLTNSPTKPVHRDASAFPSEETLRKTTKGLLNETSHRFKDKQVRDWRRQTEHMIGRIGNTGLVGKLNKLTDKQFATLWAGTGFVNNAVSLYWLMQAMLDSGDSAIFDSEFDEVASMLDWAATL